MATVKRRRSRKEVLRDERSLLSIEQLNKKISVLDKYSLMIVLQYPLSYKLIKKRSVAFFKPMYAEYLLLADFYVGSIIQSSESSISLDFVLVGPYSETIINSIPLCVFPR